MDRWALGRVLARVALARALLLRWCASSPARRSPKAVRREHTFAGWV
jgi:hypothetical protein